MRIATIVMGSLTAGYGVLEFAKPDILARQTEMTSHPAIAARLRRVSQLLGARDVLSGTALALARTRTQRRVATAVRAAFDVTDGVVLSSTLPRPAPTAKILAITGGWALLSVAAGIVADRTDR